MSLRFRAKTAPGWTVDSPLQPFVFPDGAVHIKGADNPQEFKYQVAVVTGLSHDDLFTLAMWAEVSRERGEQTVLILPYLPGARMDRGVPNGSYVYSQYINNIVQPDQIITIDPHSEDAVAWYPTHKMVRDWEDTGPRIRVKSQDYFKVFPVERIIRNEVQDPSSDSKPNNTYQGVIAPDKGAHDRAAAAAKVMGNLPVYTGGKSRDFETGRITGFHMEDELPDEGRFLIVDDICDGGGTFLALAEATGLPKERLDLWVTHGIFSRGIQPLLDRFGVIHTTDSFFSDSHTYFPSSVPGTHLVDKTRVKVHKLGAYLEAEINL